MEVNDGLSNLLVIKNRVVSRTIDNIAEPDEMALQSKWIHSYGYL